MAANPVLENKKVESESKSFARYFPPIRATAHGSFVEMTSIIKDVSLNIQGCKDRTEVRYDLEPTYKPLHTSCRIPSHFHHAHRRPRTCLRGWRRCLCACLRAPPWRKFPALLALRASEMRAVGFRMHARAISSCTYCVRLANDDT